MEFGKPIRVKGHPAAATPADRRAQEAEGARIAAALEAGLPVREVRSTSSTGAAGSLHHYEITDPEPKKKARTPLSGGAGMQASDFDDV